MKKRTIGGRSVGAVGLGCMGMSFAYGPADQNEALKTLERALELGCDFWDTADAYGAGANETLIGGMLAGRRNSVFLATKCGFVQDRTKTTHQDLVEKDEPMIIDGTPRYVRWACETSLQRLGTDVIDLYYLHRIDRRVPIEETVGTLKDLLNEGKIRHIGLSEASAATIRRAHKEHPITALQSEYSLFTRDIESEILPTVRELGIKLVAYSPLGRGLISGAVKNVSDLDETDFRRAHPRFQADVIAGNVALADRVDAMAKRHGATPAQVALAWVLSRGEDVLPIPGTKRVAYLEQNIGADALVLTAADLDELDDIKPVGDRYSERGMALLNG